MNRPLKILCYGDSNTWGYNPKDGSRYPADVRWPSVMADCLGKETVLYEEGLNGRTICSFLPGTSSPLNGLDHLQRIIHRYRDADLAVLSLGINDLFQSRELTVEQIAMNIGYGTDCIREEIENVIIVSPPPVRLGRDLEFFYSIEKEKSLAFAEEYRKIADSRDAFFIDAGAVIHACEIDGVHIEGDQHIIFGSYLCGFIQENV